MKLLKQAHTVYQTQYHVVWVTRYRKKILTKPIEPYLRTLLTKDARKFLPDVMVEEIGTDRDHIHMHLVIPPKYAVSKIMEALKSNTSRLIRKKFPGILKDFYWDDGGIWGTGFFVSTVGLNETTIRNYVSQQGRHDAGQRATLFGSQ